MTVGADVCYIPPAGLRFLWSGSSFYSTYCLGILIESQAEILGMSQATLMRPFGEANLGDQPRIHPADVNLPRFRGHLRKVDNNEIGGLRCRNEDRVASTVTSTSQKRFD